jgi:hypothetical protein
MSFHHAYARSAASAMAWLGPTGWLVRAQPSPRVVPAALDLN